MKLVELIKGIATSQETFDVVKGLTESLGKIPEEANDYPGFIVNRILMPMINEAVFALMEGVGTVEAIDESMKLGANHPMGPLALADLIGLDVCPVHHRGSARRLQRSQIPTLPPAAEDGGCRLPGAKVRARAFTITLYSAGRQILVE